MTTTNDLLNGIQTVLKDHFPGLKTCEVHDGRFDKNELARISTRSPAMFIATIGMPEIMDPGTEQAEATHALVVYIVTKDTPNLKKGPAARNLVDALLPLVMSERWALPDVCGSYKLSAANLFASETERIGFAMWAVTWRQAVRLGENPWNEEGVLPTQLYVSENPLTTNDYDQDPEEITPEAGDYEEILGDA